MTFLQIPILVATFWLLDRTVAATSPSGIEFFSQIGLVNKGLSNKCWNFVVTFWSLDLTLEKQLLNSSALHWTFKASPTAIIIFVKSEILQHK